MNCKVLIVLLFCAVSSVRSQSVHFSFVSNTGINATIAIPVSSHPMFDNVGIAQGDEIGVFSPAGLCAGAAVWTGGNIGLVVWGDNQFTSEIDGMRTGEAMTFRLWQKQSNREFTTVAAVFSSGSGVFAPNGLSVISSLAAIVPHLPGIPHLLQPADSAKDISTSALLQWQSADNALHYRIHVATDGAFASIVDSGVVDVLMKQTSKLNSGTKYYWRVRAENTDGQGAWSGAFRFITLSLPDAPVLMAPENGAADVSVNAVLEWRPVSRATSYLVHLSSDSLFHTLIDPAVTQTVEKKTPLLSSHAEYFWRVRSLNDAGWGPYSPVFRFTTVLVSNRGRDDTKTAREFKLEQNYPNPFNPETRIQFSVTERVRVRLAIYDLLGRVRAVLVDEVLSAGWYSAVWNASGMGSGMYVCRLTAGTYASAKTMVFAK